MGLTTTGWVSKRYPEIFAELQDELRAQVSPTLDVSSTSVIGEITAIFAAALAKQYDLAAAVYDSGNKDKAEGKNLDDIAALVGVERLSSFPSSGNLLVRGSLNSVVQASTIFSSQDGAITAAPTVDSALSTAFCYDIKFKVGFVAPNTAYTVVVNGNTFTYTSTSSPTTNNILSGLSNVINNYLVINPDQSYTCTFLVDSLYITSTVNSNLLQITHSSNLSCSEIGKLISALVLQEGAIEVLPATITKIATPQLGILSVTNLDAFQIGRNTETDEELRKRISTSVQIAGKATVPAIKAALLNVPGVTTVNILENINSLPDAQGMPPHSIQCIVEGGIDQDIADTLWEVKPAGIETFSINPENVFIVIDLYGEQHSVMFTRPVPKYVFLKITASLYDEEVFPSSGGEAAVKEAVTNYGNTLGTGKDIICKRFYGPVYNAVSGIGNLVITAAYRDDPNDVPLPGEYVEILSVAATEVSRFDPSRVSFEII